MSEVREVIIIGSGPTGYTAAVYAARANLHPLVFEGALEAGGALMNTTEVENFPGFPQGIMGPELMMNMKEQAQRFGAELITDDVTEVDLTGAIKRVKDATGTWHEAKTVILAMGSGYRHLGLADEERLSGKGVSWCATCDGFFFKGKDLAVIGGGDSAMEEATFLTRFAESVTIVHRRGELRASKIMQARAQNDPKIRFELDVTVEGITGEKSVEGLVVRDNATGETRELAVQGVFEAIGHDPRSALVADQVSLDAAGYVMVQPDSTATNLPGVFAAGDLVDHTYRQAITAAGTGCAAALDAERYLQELADAVTVEKAMARGDNEVQPVAAN
ncbi:thioredoxin-disulfide reductase [Nigerium massiliense]|uniref:thioredoxin-disulfide reductase n=1 Tax=Nigerium massiliense TaxID=1522317 RepID=UPI00058E49EC|nr:thioredoxin-disulfide reductase [Nigerium massiliense]